MNYHTIYHITKKTSLYNILKNNYLSSHTGCIYACPTLEDALKFIAFSEKWAIDECIILELHLPLALPNKWKESTDHNKKYIPADAIIYADSKLPFSKADIIGFS